MPIGVPKVPFRSPGEEDASWVDVYIEDDTKDLYLFINSPEELFLWYIIRVMIHLPASSFYEAQTGEFLLEAEELLKLRETLTRVYVQRTGKPLWVISEDLERDVFMSATEAQAHGIVDLVAVE
ncbi:ATP-dependent Clp protease proteolytic subunit [Bienertia sinuspersici]